MSNPEHIVHWAIIVMQMAESLLMSLAVDLPVGTGIDAFDVEQLRRALESIAEVLRCDSLQCQYEIDGIERERMGDDPPSDVTLPSPPSVCRVGSLRCHEDMSSIVDHMSDSSSLGLSSDEDDVLEAFGWLWGRIDDGGVAYNPSSDSDA
jgi:hypothetical protein